MATLLNFTNGLSDSVGEVVLLFSTGYPTQSVSCLHRVHRMHVNAVMRFNDFRQPMSGSHGLALFFFCSRR